MIKRIQKSSINGNDFLWEVCSHDFALTTVGCLSNLEVRMANMIFPTMFVQHIFTAKRFRTNTTWK